MPQSPESVVAPDPDNPISVSLASLVSVDITYVNDLVLRVKEPAEVVLSRETSVDLSTFRTLTPKLVAAAETYGVRYDGWETFVVTDRSKHPAAKTEH